MAAATTNDPELSVNRQYRIYQRCHELQHLVNQKMKIFVFFCLKLDAFSKYITQYGTSLEGH